MQESQFKRHKNFKNNFTSIPNALIRSNLGNAAFRLLCYLASNSETWKVYQSIIMKELDWGREMLRGAISELVEKKYIIVIQQKNDKSQFSHNNYEFDFDPIEDSKNVSEDGFPAHGFAEHGEPPSTNLNLNEDQSIKEKREEKKEFSLLSYEKDEYEEIRKSLEKEGYSNEHISNTIAHASQDQFWIRTITNKESFIRNFKTMMGQSPKLKHEMSEVELFQDMVRRINKEEPLSLGHLKIDKDHKIIIETHYLRNYPFERGVDVVYRQIMESYGKS